MNFYASLSEIIMGNLQGVIVALTVMIFIALVVFININIKLTAINKRYQQMMKGTSGENLEKMLIKHIEEVRSALTIVEGMAENSAELQRVSKKCIQKQGIVRFRAFEDTGSDLSFALALLDGENNGVVLSNIYGRNESRTYAKPIVDGKSQYFLTDEEKQALNQAWGIKN
jgi:hypothetical protein